MKLWEADLFHPVLNVLKSNRGYKVQCILGLSGGAGCPMYGGCIPQVGGLFSIPSIVSLFPHVSPCSLSWFPALSIQIKKYKPNMTEKN